MAGVQSESSTRCIILKVRGVLFVCLGQFFEVPTFGVGESEQRLHDMCEQTRACLSQRHAARSRNHKHQASASKGLQQIDTNKEFSGLFNGQAPTFYVCSAGVGGTHSQNMGQPMSVDTLDIHSYSEKS